VAIRKLARSKKFTDVPCTFGSDTGRRDCVLIAVRGIRDMSESPRLKAILPLKIFVDSESEALTAHTTDISASGVKIILSSALDPGRDVVLEYRKKRVRAVVVWSKPMSRISRDYQIGMRLLEDGQRFWLVNMAPKAQVLSHHSRQNWSGPRF
jgi:PilZ domain-containing protein